MKNRITLGVWMVLCSLLSIQGFAQTNVNMPLNTGVQQTFTIAPPGTCFFNFFDNGGAAANYSNNSQHTLSVVTFCPTAGQKIRASFSAFQTEATWDALYVYDGTTTASPQIASANGQGGWNLPFAGGWWGAVAPNNGGLPAGQVQATAANASGCLTFQFDCDASVNCGGWAANVAEAPPPGSCTVTTSGPANITVGTGAAAVACTANAVVASPTFSPAGCLVNFSLRYRVNGGTPVVLGNVVPATITLLNLPKGVNTILWEVFVACGGTVISSAVQTVTVVDTTNPVINCPANVTINLDPGECFTQYAYAVTATDNCPFFGPITSLLAPQTGSNAFNGITFDVSNHGADPIQITGFTAPVPAGAHPTVAYVTTAAATAVGNQSNAGAWTLLSAPGLTVTGAGNFPTWPTFASIPLASPFVLAPGQTKGFYLAITDGNGNFGYQNGNRTTSDANIDIISNGHGGGQWPFVNANNPRAFFGTVEYQTVTDATPVQTTGLPSGAEFPRGTTTNCFLITDIAGNTATCCFSVTVNEYPNAIHSLICNDLVNISVDENCSAVILADQILEGGPYGCYDDYIVELDRVAPYGNGPWTPGVVGPNDIGRTYGVRVTDPETGNKCWGLVKIEDKLAPNLVCQDATLACNFNTDPTFKEFATVTNRYGATGLPITLPDLTTRTIVIPVGAPADAIINDVDFYELLTGDVWFFNVTIRVTSPQGTTVTVWNQVGGCAPAPFWTRFDDEGSNALTCVDYTTGVNAFIPFGFGVLSDFDGENPNGNWIVEIADVDGFGDQSLIEEIALFINLTGTFGAGFPNDLVYDPNPNLSDLVQIGPKQFRVIRHLGTPVLEACCDATLSYIDTKTPQTCASGFTETINRKWTAVDCSGNTSTCLQLINRQRPTLADVTVPPDYDGIDAPFFDCVGSSYPTPEYIENLGLQGWPWVFGQPDGCSINWTYFDHVIDVCDGTYKIRREWSIIDWCLGTGFEYNQILKVVDQEGPTWKLVEDQFTTEVVNGVTFQIYDALPPLTGRIRINTATGAIQNTLTLTATTDPFTCCASVNLPDFVVEDNCSRINNVAGMIVAKTCEGDILGMTEVVGNVTNFPGNNFWDLDTLAAYGQTSCLPLGRHEVWYTAEDDCGNTSSCTFTLNVIDLTPPQISCDEYTVVTVGYDDPVDCYLQDPISCEFAGVSWVDAEVFDDHSFDNCGNIYFTVRRMPTDTNVVGNSGQVIYNSFIDTLINTDGDPFPACDPFDPFIDFPVTEYQQATGLTNAFITLNFTAPVFPFPQGLPQNHPYPAGAGYEVLDALQYDGCTVYPDYPLVGRDSIKFYCDEVGTTQTVILRGYQIDGQGRMQLDRNGEPIYNECMVQVEVQDKIKPTCIAPANVTVSCEAFDPSLWAYGYPTAYDNCCLDVTKSIVTGIATYKGITEQRNYALFDTLCNKGTITRTFRVYDCHGLSNTCTQRVFVNYRQDYHVRFPDDRVVFECDGTTTFGEPVINKKDCELMAISYEDQVFTVVPDACYKIERVWQVINWCTYDPNFGCIAVPNPNPNTLPNAANNLRGPTVSAPGTPAPWTATTERLVPGGPLFDYSTIWSANANCYTYKQIIKVIDNEDPVIDSWELDDCDLTANDRLFWNTQDWWDPIHSQHDLCEAPVKISLTAIDSCSGSNVDTRALVFLDLDGDGVMETVLNTNDFPTLPAGFIRFNNAFNPSYGGGILREFDHRLVPANLKYRFALREQVIGGRKKTSIMWTDRVNPNPNNNNDWVLPQIPLGKHKIKWFVEDNCGNETIWESPWDLHDCKPPTVVCLNGLSVNIMPTGMIIIWATDFLQYTEDNCTPANQLVLSIRESGTGTGFPVDANGNPIPGVTFDCTELGAQFVELWAKDARGNASYCETFIMVQDPDNACSPIQKASVAGDLKTEAANGLEEANVEINGTHPALAPISMFQQSAQTGHYEFGDVIPVAGNYTVTPVKDDNPLNGVSTYDLLLMSKHILGVEPLNSPYKMIAADVNKSGSITTFDIVELRKLILGIYTELPNNTSWRFVDKSYSFPNPANPFTAAFPETRSIADLAGDMMGEHFVSVKIGDVNLNAVANNAMSADDRTAGTLLFDVEDRAVKAGEEFTVNFKAAEKVNGYQFTMNHTNLEVMELVPGTNMKAENFAVFAKEGALTTSFDGDVQAEFSVKFRAKADGQISKMLGVSSRITKAEAYSQSSDRYEVAFRFNNGGSSTIAGVGFELYQNQPNPFVSKTVIGFNLPEATEATLTIFDETGRTLFTQKGDFAKGVNAIAIERAVLHTTGVMYYKLETATESASKKMIQTK